MTVDLWASHAAPTSLAAGVAVLAGLGFLDALYFVSVTYRWMRSDPAWLPQLCRLDDATCVRILDTRYARVFGVPNSVLGLVWYGLLLSLGAWALTNGSMPACAALTDLAGGVVLLSAFLAWSLLVKLRTPCLLCFASHTISLLLFGVFLALCS